MRYYAEFSQIGSHMSIKFLLVPSPAVITTVISSAVITTVTSSAVNSCQATLIVPSTVCSVASPMLSSGKHYILTSSSTHDNVHKIVVVERIRKWLVGHQQVLSTMVINLQ